MLGMASYRETASSDLETRTVARGQKLDVLLARSPDPVSRKEVRGDHGNHGVIWVFFLFPLPRRYFPLTLYVHTSRYSQSDLFIHHSQLLVILTVSIVL